MPLSLVLSRISAFGGEEAVSEENRDLFVSNWLQKGLLVPLVVSQEQIEGFGVEAVKTVADLEGAALELKAELLSKIVASQKGEYPDLEPFLEFLGEDREPVENAVNTVMECLSRLIREKNEGVLANLKLVEKQAGVSEVAPDGMVKIAHPSRSHVEKSYRTNKMHVELDNNSPICLHSACLNGFSVFCFNEQAEIAVFENVLDFFFVSIRSEMEREEFASEFIRKAVQNNMKFFESKASETLPLMEINVEEENLTEGDKQ